MKELTLLVAHCDDEFLFMFPALQEYKVKKIICVTSDKHNPNRVWCKDRAKAFEKVCEAVGAEPVCMDFSSRFFSLPNKELAEVMEAVRSKIKTSDALFTHNAWGEYGHLDHVMCHQIAQMRGLPFFTQDIVVQADWYPVKGYCQGRVERGPVRRDLGAYAKFSELYASYGAWGWSWGGVEAASVIEVMP